MNCKLLQSCIVGTYFTKVRTHIYKNKVNARKRRWMYNASFYENEESHERIFKLLTSDKPVMIARYGFTEINIIGCYLTGGGYGRWGNYLYDTAGFFSKGAIRTNVDLNRFAQLMIADSGELDLLGASYAMYEDYVFNHYCKNSEITEFDNLRVMVCDNSWGRALKGKKVLVIHPFSKSIESQYKRRKQIWANENILPEFKLITYKAIQTIAGNNTENYSDWFEALDIMKKDISKIDFDITIIGCGAYGFPLAAECKRIGKKAIHLGGQVQMMFGISGKRWEEIPYYQQFINEYWVHPMEEEIPNNFKKVEGGCYW